MLFGPVGTGKDHLAVGVLAAAVGADLSVDAINGQDWYGQLRDRISDRESDTEASFIASLVRPDVLLISDPLPTIGVLTQHQATMLYRVVDDRYSRCKATVVTLNVENADEAEQAIGATTWDRLCSGAWIVSCRWASARKPLRVVC